MKKPKHEEYKKRQIAAGKELAKAIRKGIIERPDKCWRCKKKCIPVGHHFDYRRPLDVCWLCTKCHFAIHVSGFMSVDRKLELTRLASLDKNKTTC
jgi:hypothetical protein